MSAARMPTVPVTAGPQDALRLVGVSKVYGSDVGGAAARVTALREVSLAFPAGSTFRQCTDIPKTARDLLTALKIDVPRKIHELTTPES